MLGQIIAALVVIIYGDISLKGAIIPFLPSNVSHVIAIIVTIGWIVGISNAVNLIDGLDGLCGGISIIVLVTVWINFFDLWSYRYIIIIIIVSRCYWRFLSL